MAFDVSKGHASKVLYKEDRCISEGVIEFNRTEFTALSEEIHNLPELPIIVYESTGIYSRPLESFCINEQIPFVELNPLDASNQIKSLSLRRVKTDSKDAHNLALTHNIFKRSVKQIPEQSYQEIKSVGRLYQEISDQISVELNRLYEAIYICFPDLKKFFSNVTSPYALSFIQQYPHPSWVLDDSTTVVEDKLIQTTGRIRSSAYTRRRTEQFIELAKNCFSSVPSDSVECERLQFYARMIENLVFEKQQLNKR